MQFHTISDMGSMKVFSDRMSAFFANGVGDGGNRVDVITRKRKGVNIDGHQFLGHFTVKQENEVHLSSYDCEDDAIHTFGVGRWFVYLVKEAHFRIEFCDNEIHS